jgi:hypothetical protein
MGAPTITPSFNSIKKKGMTGSDLTGDKSQTSALKRAIDD